MLMLRKTYVQGLRSFPLNGCSLIKSNILIQQSRPRRIHLSSAAFGNGILKSDYGNLQLPTEDICSFQFSRWEKWPQKVALECVTTGKQITYNELLESSLRWGSALQRIVPKSLNSEDVPRISIFSPNELEYAPLVFGSLAARWTLSTVNSNYKVGEVMHSLDTVRPNALVVHSTLEEIADEALVRLKMDIPVLTIGASKKGKPNVQDIVEDIKNDKLDFKEIDPSTPALILQSGGTTGLPKSVVIPHISITSNTVCLTDPRIHAFGGEEYPHVTVTALMPFYHLYGMYVVMMVNLYLGSKILVFKSFDPLQYGNCIHKHQIQFLHIVPTLLNFIINSGNVTSKHLSSLVGVLIAAAPVLPTAAKALQEMLSKEIIFQEGFGMTEIIGSHLTPKDSVKIGFCGKLIPNTEAKVIDLKTKEPLGPNQEGELLIRRPAMMSHYLNNPEATAESLDEEGWLHTGDVATYTEDGYFSIVDRIKDILKVKSFQVSPAEIEDTLMKHKAVAEAGVVGVPDPVIGERPRAYVTLKSEATPEELIKHVEDYLSRYKRLTGGVRIVSELPKNQTGKLLRRDLKELVKKEIRDGLI